MTELVLFTLNAVVIYVLADALLRLVERRRGGALPQRQVIFFVIFLTLALISFAALRQLLGPA